MKKFTFLLAASVMFTAALQAKPIDAKVAKMVAQNFYSRTYPTPINSVTLAFTEKDATGLEDYYVFNINGKDGFVIVSAEDAGHPIIGYSNKGQYVIPIVNNSVDYWIKRRKTEIESIRSLKLTASKDIVDEWNAYINNAVLQNSHNKSHKAMGIFPSSSNHLVQSTWDQPSPYNALCPGGSVTGCVATAMAQIMRYWSYPPKGMGSSCYVDSTTYGYSQNYGKLCANYGADTYDWASMPLNASTASFAGVSQLMYDAGVSVQMDYSPSGSGAWVISLDDTICSQRSYVKYFGYNAKTINGFYDSLLAPTALVDTIENELNNNRPVQYVGADPAQGGHTWVCDGYDTASRFHMNWGWSGQDDGWYLLTNLNPGSLKFTEQNEALIGIEPPIIVAHFNGYPLSGCAGTTVSFTDQSFSPSNITAWKWSFPGGTPS
ncbi:MAG TPA: C10 family peptidase, partial [Bacteroidia bacterium]|nr:C10 family peptidase [Bacteroidia bacterium]